MLTIVAAGHFAGRPRGGRAAWLALLLLAGGCQNPPSGARAAERPGPARRGRQPDAAPDVDRPVPEGTERSRALAARELAKFESESSQERVMAARQLAAMGELALAPLLQALVRHPGERTRGMAAYTLGYMNDRRAVEPLVGALADPVPSVHLDAAAALLRLGDDRGFAPLIAGLEDADPSVRARCLGILRDAVDATFGYEPDGDPLERRAAVARWRGWLVRRREGGS